MLPQILWLKPWLHRFLEVGNWECPLSLYSLSVLIFKMGMIVSMSTVEGGCDAVGQSKVKSIQSEYKRYLACGELATSPLNYPLLPAFLPLPPFSS